MAIDIGEHCIDCRRSVAFGSGLFVNRIPADNGDLDGYLCVECLSEECETCGEITPEWTARNEIVQCEACADGETFRESQYAIDAVLSHLSAQNPALHASIYPHWKFVIDWINEHTDGPR